MRPADWAVVAAYLTWVVWDGLRQARRSKDVEGYLVAGRSLPWWMVGMSVMATQLSAITMIGTTGQAYANGMRFGDAGAVLSSREFLHRVSVSRAAF